MTIIAKPVHRPISPIIVTSLIAITVTLVNRSISLVIVTSLIAIVVTLVKASVMAFINAPVISTHVAFVIAPVIAIATASLIAIIVTCIPSITRVIAIIQTDVTHGRRRTLITVVIAVSPNGTSLTTLTGRRRRERRQIPIRLSPKNSATQISALNTRQCALIIVARFKLQGTFIGLIRIDIGERDMTMLAA